MIELMVALSILSILAAIAAPSLSYLIERWSVKKTTESLRNSLQIARSEAIKNGSQIVIQKIPNNTFGCSTAVNNREWDCGWIICNDSNKNNTCNTNETIVHKVESDNKTHISRTGGGTTITFNRWGSVSGTYIGFNIVPINKNLSHTGSQGLCMSSGGRIRVVSSEDIPCTN